MDKTRDRFSQWAPALFVLLWSTGFVGAKFGLPFAEPFTFLFLRYGVVTVILGTVLLLWRVPLPRRPAMWGHLALTGLLLHGFYIGGVFVAIAHGMSSGIAALIVGIQPLLTAGVAGSLLGERVSQRQFAGLLLGFAGLSLTVSKTFVQGELPAIGLVACLMALLAITFGTIYQKRHVADVDLRAGAFVQFLATALVFATLSITFDTGKIDWSPEFLFALGWLCLVLSLGAISLLWRLIQRGAAAKVASLFYLVPPVTAVEGYFLFGESLTSLQMIGIAVTALGVAIINRG